MVYAADCSLVIGYLRYGSGEESYYLINLFFFY